MTLDKKIQGSLFKEEEHFLSEARRLLEQKGDTSIDWIHAYEELTSKYSKLLHDTSKLVKISDHSQRHLRLKNYKIQELADTDNLTGLPNRRGSMKLIHNEVQKCLRYKIPLALFIMDIDFFKLVNDTWGHATGDLVLKNLSDNLRSTLRSCDILGRWGGEEFILILSETDAEGAKTIAEKIRSHIETSAFISEKDKINITISLGGTMYNNGMNLDNNLEIADKALYESKENGRNRVTFYEI